MTYYIGALLPMMFAIGSALTGLYACHICRGNYCQSWNDFYTFIFGWLLSPIFAVIHSALLIVAAKESPILLINQDRKDEMNDLLTEIYGTKYKTVQLECLHSIVV